jgi:hypothetical protein
MRAWGINFYSMRILNWFKRKKKQDTKPFTHSGSKSSSGVAPSTGDDILSNPLHPLNPISPFSIYHNNHESNNDYSNPSHDYGGSVDSGAGSGFSDGYSSSSDSSSSYDSGSSSSSSFD